MKERILYYVDFQLTHFIIAKILQEHSDFESFAIIDVNEKSKRFFQEQDLVKFEKVWYYRDYLVDETKLPDLKYLSSFEEKYRINLWKIAFAERAFQKYNRYYKFKNNEILSILENECRKFEEILDEVKPNFLFINLTDWHHMHLLCEICKAKGIKVLMIVPTRFDNKIMISQELDEVDPTIDYINNKTNNMLTAEDLQKYLGVHDSFKKYSELKNKMYSYNWETLKAAKKFFFNSQNNTYRKHYTNFGKTKSKVLLVEIRVFLKKKYREFFINRNSVKNIDEHTPFVFFPLHVEPERVLLIGSPFYTNQIEVIKNIAKALPVNYKLYVKEHPLMYGYGWREVSFYKEILAIPNVCFVHPSIKPHELLRRCALVITISGSTAVEAAFYKKPAIIFSGFWGYSLFSSVYKLKNITELPDAIRSYLNKTTDLNDLNNYVDTIEKNAFEFDYNSIFADLLTRFYYGGFLTDVEIPISKVKSFLDDHYSEFKKVAFEHIKKIEQYKKENLVKSHNLNLDNK